MRRIFVDNSGPNTVYRDFDSLYPYITVSYYHGSKRIVARRKSFTIRRNEG